MIVQHAVTETLRKMAVFLMDCGVHIIGRVNSTARIDSNKVMVLVGRGGRLEKVFSRLTASKGCNPSPSVRSCSFDYLGPRLGLSELLLLLRVSGRITGAEVRKEVQLRSGRSSSQSTAVIPLARDAVARGRPVARGRRCARELLR